MAKTSQPNHVGPITNLHRSEEYGALQKLVDTLFKESEFASSMDAVVLAESLDLPTDLQEVVHILPPGVYARQSMCDQFNSSIAGHAWGQVYGTVE